MDWLQIKNIIIAIVSPPIINIIAIVLSPIIAIIIGEFLRRRNFTKAKKLDILHSLIAYRHKIDDDHFLSAINSLILFYKNQELRQLLFELRKAFDNQGKSDIEIVKVIKKVCELEKFKNVSENDIENLFKKNLSN